MMLNSNNGVNNKRALPIAEIMQVCNYNPEISAEQFAKDIFVFSYLSSRMNSIDVFRLKWSDIKGNHFSFVKKKTENKEGGTNKITIILNENLLQVLERDGTRKIGNNYIFNVIHGGCTEERLLQKVHTTIALVNVYLKKIASKLDITTEISIYYARHSFATNLMNNEVPPLLLSQSKGAIRI